MYNEQAIKTHYKEQAAIFKDSPKSTMEEQVIRDKELDIIFEFINTQAVSSNPSNVYKVLDLGCGNGYALSFLTNKIKANAQYYGVDFTQELVEIANSRNLSNCAVTQGDARKLDFEDNSIDVIYTERCLINIMDWDEQKKALNEIHRILKPNGKYLMIECFTDGMENNNRARVEMGLSEIGAADHNFYFDKSKLQDFISNKFNYGDGVDFGFSEKICSNFLSSHYFVARILHPLITKGEWKKNTEFIKFFSHLAPAGNYSPLQALILEKK